MLACSTVDPFDAHRVGLDAVKSQHNILQSAMCIRHDQPLDHRAQRADVCLHAIRALKHVRGQAFEIVPCLHPPRGIQEGARQEHSSSDEPGYWMAAKVHGWHCGDQVYDCPPHMCGDSGSIALLHCPNRATLFVGVPRLPWRVVRFHGSSPKYG